MCRVFILTSSLAIKPRLSHPTQSRHVRLWGLANPAFIHRRGCQTLRASARSRLWASPASEASSFAELSGPHLVWAAPAARSWGAAEITPGISSKEQNSESAWDGELNARRWVVPVEKSEYVAQVRQSLDPQRWTRGLESPVFVIDIPLL